MELKSFLNIYKDLKEIKKGSILSIESFSFLEDPKDNTICFLKNKKYFDRIGKRSTAKDFKNSLLVIDEKLKDSVDQKYLETIFNGVYVHPNTSELILNLSKEFFLKKFGELNMLLDGRQLGTVEIHSSADIAQNVFIGENSKIGKNVQIYPGSVIGPEVSIGDNSVIYPNVTIYPFTKIGQNCRVHSNTVIGSDGFGYEFIDGEHKKIWHVGGVNIEDNVEIGASSTIDMGVMHATHIGTGTKLDGQVHVGHNCYIGKHCIICGQTGMAGSAVLDDYCVLGGRVAIGPDVYLEAGTQVAGASVVNDGAHFPAKSVIGGYPARLLKEWMKEVAFLRIASKNRNKK